MKRNNYWEIIWSTNRFNNNTKIKDILHSIKTSIINLFWSTKATEKDDNDLKYIWTIIEWTENPIEIISRITWIPIDELNDPRLYKVIHWPWCDWYDDWPQSYDKLVQRTAIFPTKYSPKTKRNGKNLSEFSFYSYKFQNLHIHNSYLAKTEKEMFETLEDLPDNIKDEIHKYRTNKDMVNEWKVHNFLYKLDKIWILRWKTADVDCEMIISPKLLKIYNRIWENLKQWMWQV